MKICTKCVIPETAETNTYDDTGICSVCKQIEVKSRINWQDRAQDLDDIINNLSFLSPQNLNSLSSNM